MSTSLDRLSLPFRGSDAVRDRRTTADRLRGPTFERVGPDTYAGAGVDRTRLAVRLGATALWAGQRGVIAGPLAALALGAECPWDGAEVVLPVRPGSVPAGVLVRTDRLAPHEVETLDDGVRVTSPLRTAFDLARRGPLVDAVAAADALAFRGRFGTPALTELAAEHPRARGSRLLREVVELMDPRAESPMETRTRLVFVFHGVPAPVTQYEMFLPGYGEVRVDFAWPFPGPGGRRLVVEYDGPEHRTIAGQNRDNRRDAALRRAGWEVVHVSSQLILDRRLARDLAAEVIATVRP